MARPRSNNPTPSALRMRRLMERRRHEGRGIVQLTPTEETMGRLETLSELTGGSVKSDAEMILRRGVLSALSEARQLAQRIGPIYRQAKQYLPYASYLSTPGAAFRVGNQVLKATDWQPLAVALGSYYDTTQRVWGWSRQRADAFLKRAASS